nr:molecular chaperone HtpG [Lachnospiraceae bacterium]
DENGNAVEAEELAPKSEDTGDEDAQDENAAEDEKKEKVIYYVTDEKQQSQYIAMFRQAKMTAVILDHTIDQPFISQLESKNEGIKFARIDADLTDSFSAKTGKKAAEELAKQSEELEKKIRKALKKDSLKVSLQKLKNKKIASVLTISEETRRMQDMMKMYGGGMDMNMFGAGGEGATLVLNANHPLVQYVLSDEDSKNGKLICEQLYDLAMLQNAPLAPEEMTAFIQRSNEIMMLLSGVK